MGEEMREIVFRVWDKQEKKWADSSVVQYAGLGTTGWVREPTDRYIIVQYTGLKDKNGKEIYTGDIVKNHWYDVNGKFIGGLWVVKYGMHSIEGQDYYSNSGEGFYFDAQSGIDDDTYNIANLPFDEDKGGIEIIGNVFENPEIMEGK